MKLLRSLLAVTALLWFINAGQAHAVVTQLGLVIDTSSSMDAGDEAIAKAGITAALAGIATDGSIEVTVVQFSASAATIFSPTVIASDVDRDTLIAAINNIDPTSTDIPPFNGGTNFEDAFLVVTDALTNSSEFATRNFAMINVLSDANPTTHNHLGLEDIDEDNRMLRARNFGADARDAAVAAGIELISFELIDPPTGEPGGLPYAQTLVYPGPGIVDPPAFADPFTDEGFIFNLAGVADIQAALEAKFAAAGFIVPEPASAMLLITGSVLICRRRRS